MPFPSDETLVQVRSDLIAQFDAIFRLHPGFRPAHAKGTVLTGSFAPSSEAASLTRTPHTTRESTPVTARFSNSTGVPGIPDENPNARPRGLAVRFHVGEQVRPDIISHSAEGLPTRTGQESLESLRASGSLVLSSKVPDGQDQQQRIIFEPIPRVDGIEASDDPLLELRAAVYLLSGRRRRQAQGAERRAGA